MTNLTDEGLRNRVEIIIYNGVMNRATLLCSQSNSGLVNHKDFMAGILKIIEEEGDKMMVLIQQVRDAAKKETIEACAQAAEHPLIIAIEPDKIPAQHLDIYNAELYGAEKAQKQIVTAIRQME